MGSNVPNTSLNIVHESVNGVGGEGLFETRCEVKCGFKCTVVDGDSAFSIKSCFRLDLFVSTPGFKLQDTQDVSLINSVCKVPELDMGGSGSNVARCLKNKL